MHLQQMIRAAEAAYPNECCGLLAGVNLEDGVYEISRVVESRNIHPEGGRDRFEVDPKIRFDLMRELGQIGDVAAGIERLIGHYHSHPDHPVTPSRQDLACAYEPDLFWVILSLYGRSVSQVSAYQLKANKKQFCQIPLRRTNGTTYAIAPDHK